MSFLGILFALVGQGQDATLPRIVIPKGQKPHPVLACVQQIVGTGQFKVAGPLPSLPEKGVPGTATDATAMAFHEPDGTRDRSMESIFKDYPLGELVQPTTIEQRQEGKRGSVSVIVTSLLKHNITRGQGTFQHQSPERLSVEIFFPLSMSCDVAKSAWSKVLKPATPQEVAEALARFPSGVIVEELRQGMTPQEVKAAGAEETGPWAGLRWGTKEPDVLAAFPQRAVRLEKPRQRKTAPVSAIRLHLSTTSPQIPEVDLGFDESGGLNVVAFQPKTTDSFGLFRLLDQRITERHGQPASRKDDGMSMSREWNLDGGVTIEMSRLFARGVADIFSLMCSHRPSAGSPPSPAHLLVVLAEGMGAASSSRPNSTEGYRDTKWGMTAQQVRQVYPDAKEVGGTLMLAGEVGGKEAATGFRFAADRLAQVVVVFTKEYVNKNSYTDDYRELKALLSEKYGSPKDDSADWSDRLYADDPSKVGMAVSVGHLRLQVVWETQLTRITLMCRGENFKVTLGLRYDSKEFEGQALDEDKKKKLKEL